MNSGFTRQQPTTRHNFLGVSTAQSSFHFRDLSLLETRPEQLLKVMEVGTVSTNVVLRRVHNFALDMGWLPGSVIPKKHWPKVRFREKRAITPEKHRAILDHEPNLDGRRSTGFAGCSARHNRTWLSSKPAAWTGRHGSQFCAEEDEDGSDDSFWR